MGLPTISIFTLFTSFDVTSQVTQWPKNTACGLSILKSSTIFEASSVPKTRFLSLRVKVCSEIPSS
nr:MAG TPA: hypothetical protein [Caudoviricetes sp.]